MCDAISQLQAYSLDLMFAMIKDLREVHENAAYESVIIKDATKVKHKYKLQDKDIDENSKYYHYESTTSQELAQSILEKVFHMDVMINNLPQTFETEQQQMQQIQQLIQENDKVSQKLQEKKIEAEQAQNKLTNRLKLMTKTIHNTD